MSVSVSDLVNAIGDEKISFQPLNPGVSKMEQKGGHSYITFGTDVKFSVDGLEKIGLVLWVSREDFQAAKEKLGL